MVLFQDLTLIIERLPEFNILCVRWLEQQVFRMSEFEYSFHILMENIEKYDIKKLVAQSSRIMDQLPEDQYTSMVMLLQSGLAHSNIEKVARICLDNSEQDQKCSQQFEHIMNEMELEIDFRNFDSSRKALAWLAGKQVAWAW